MHARVQQPRLRWRLILGAGCLLFHALLGPAQTEPPRVSRVVDIGLFLQPFLDNPTRAPEAFEALADAWDDSFAIMLLEVSQFTDPELRDDLVDFLQEMTGRPFGLGPGLLDVADYQWAWQHQGGTHPGYANFKAALYDRQDPLAHTLFTRGQPATIRLAEILWHSQEEEPLPTLHHPPMVRADQAGDLPANTPVLALKVNGEPRAYLRQTLLRHTALTDTINGEEVVGICCAWSGLAAFYKTKLENGQHNLQASGFIYRSATLLQDQATHSLWSILTGKPALGPLARQPIELEPLPAVATSWGAWRQKHPQTLVLSRKSETRLDPAAAAVQRAYFATDTLQFPVPKIDPRLPNKAPVLGLRLRGTNLPPLAVSLSFLRRNRVYNGRWGNTSFVLLTDRTGATRAYATSGQTFSSWDEANSAVDARKQVWLVTEEALKYADGTVLPRLPEQTAFWFAWQAAFPDTQLVR